MILKNITKHSSVHSQHWNRCFFYITIQSFFLEIQFSFLFSDYSDQMERWDLCRVSPTRGVVQCLHVGFVMSSWEALQIYSLRRINITESTSFIHESNLIMMTCLNLLSDNIWGIMRMKTRVDWMHFIPIESIKLQQKDMNMKGNVSVLLFMCVRTVCSWRKAASVGDGEDLEDVWQHWWCQSSKRHSIHENILIY